MHRKPISQKFHENGNAMKDHKEKRKKDPESSLLHLLRDFCGYTSWGGLGRVVGTKFILFKLLWLLLFLAALGMAAYQVTPLFYKYRSRPINTRISLHHNATLEFPSVVFCNFNMIRKSKIPELPKNVIDALSLYVSEDTKLEKEEEEEYQDDEDNGSNGEKYDDEDEDDYGEYDDEIDPDLLDKVYKAEERLSVLMADIDVETLKEIGHQFNDTIFTCTFKGVDCRNFKKFWSQFWHYKYGNCFVFNPYKIKGNQSKVASLRATKPGPLYGLTVALNIEQYEYVDDLTQRAGAAVQIVERGKMPFPYEEGISVAPGFSTSIGLRMLHVHREDRFNNGSCIKNITVPETNVYAEDYNITYSRTACEQSCIARTQMAECQCVEYKYPGAIGFEFCDVLNKTVVACLRKVAKKAKLGKLDCSSCRPLCFDKVFKVASSFSVWPSMKYKKSLYRSADETDEVQEDDENVTESTDNDGGFMRKEKAATRTSNNLLKVQIYFQELNFEVIEETVSYQVENFLSDIGGQMGLWLGASCLSGIEVAELLVYMVAYLLGRKNSDREHDEEAIPMEEKMLDNKENNECLS